MRKGVYPYEYIDEWEIFNETLLPHHPPPQKKRILYQLKYGGYYRFRSESCKKEFVKILR